MKIDHHGPILEFIKDYIKEYKCPPSIRGISDGTGKSPTAVVNSLKALEREGRIVRAANKTRGIEVVTKSSLPQLVRELIEKQVNWSKTAQPIVDEIVEVLDVSVG